MNYFEILDLPVNASSFEIRQAYTEALAIYDEDSLSTYSLFSGDDREIILNRIEEAFVTLMDPTSRNLYEKNLLETGEIDVTALKKERTKKPMPLFQGNRSVEGPPRRMRSRLQQGQLSDRAKEILSKEFISGADLKEIRTLIGVELQEVFEITRIGLTTLNAIEQGQYDELPPMIYVKNFLRSYAEAIGLDPQKVADGYIRHMPP